MTTVYCTECWAEQLPGAKTCWRCGADVATVPEIDYVTKLIRALDHPEPDTPARAAAILGELHAERAVGPLCHVVTERNELGLLESAATALGQIGRIEAIPALEHLLERPSFLTVRLRAIEALAAIGGPGAYQALRWAADNDPSMRVRQAAQRSLGMASPATAQS
ncbi:MAG TPA: HEAT repeat domain-containing protein [Chloroflexota bacterium]|nr:HEAT repeat domain-containing protein [Chloroflexota bacterium]